MNIDDSVKILESVTRLLGALAWPILVGLIVIRFAPSLKVFIESLGEISFKASGLEIMAKRKQAEVAAALAVANAAKRESAANPTTNSRDNRQIAELVSESLTPRVLRKANNARILWVDESPDNNNYERQALEAIGVNFVLTKSTDEAMELIKKQSFDAIIFDMKHSDDNEAGISLMEALRSLGCKIPLIIYTRFSAREHTLAASVRGSFGITGRPSELFEYVTSAIRQSA